MGKLILGFTGQMASGKSTAASYLKKKYGATSHRFSTVLRDILKRAHLEQNRENLQTISRILRQNFSEEILAKSIAEDVKKDNSDLIIIDGIRRPSDVTYLNEVPGFVLVNMKSEMGKRFERITNRNENPDDSKKTLEEFKKEHEAEPEQKIEEVASGAKEIIDNSGSVEELHKQLDEIIEKYGS